MVESEIRGVIRTKEIRDNCNRCQVTVSITLQNSVMIRLPQKSLRTWSPYHKEQDIFNQFLLYPNQDQNSYLGGCLYVFGIFHNKQNPTKIRKEESR